jgi:hypothetical protein
MARRAVVIQRLLAVGFRLRRGGGFRRRLAAELGVSEATISRDLTYLGFGRRPSPAAKPFPPPPFASGASERPRRRSGTAGNRPAAAPGVAQGGPEAAVADHGPSERGEAAAGQSEGGAGVENRTHRTAFCPRARGSAVSAGDLNS